ncbi:hypothetical protein RN001_000386 [Aquatica leii]|uniref:Uncharacterized protein n=1 Tax=Aquatica leii TaxID=1421715 RepID=A0AAN7SSF7_9COLE|nr:hypothetical protein RN001_000386 [Aquatica leii]
MLWVFLLFLMFFSTNANVYEANTTDLSKCKVHYSRSEDTYKHFYEIADESHGNDTILDFHFLVLAASDAHILFSPSMKLNKNDPAYEIVLGAGGNMFSDIRRAQKSAVKASVRLNNILSSLDPQAFWIHISKDGLIDVGREGEELGFLSWRDNDPLPLKYFSFGTWSGVEAKWYFDCYSKNGSKEVVKELTHHERLRHNLLFYYDPYVRPVLQPLDLTVIKMILNLNYISLDEYKSVLELRGTTKLAWRDEKMIWHPSDYGNVSSLHLIGRQIWRPDFVVYNAINSMGRDVLGDSMMVVTSDGSVEWNPSINIKAWCNITDLGHWPIDTHSCLVSLGVWHEFEFLQLHFNKEESNILGERFQTEWEVVKITIIDNFNWTFETSTNTLPPFFKIDIKMKRSSSVYTAVFFTPFLVVALAMLLSFCVSPFGYLKISLGCLQLIIISLILVTLAHVIPILPDRVPYLVLLYSYSCIASTICIFISIIVINLSRSTYKTNIPHWLWKFLTAYPTRFALMLPNVQASENYGKLDDDVPIINTDDNVQNTWILLGKAVDRISFIVYFILIVYAISTQY